MSLYSEWIDLTKNQTKDTFGEFWKEYSEGETRIYKDILADFRAPHKGVLGELAEKHGVRPVIYMGFLDGIQSSLNSPVDLENLDETSEVELDIDPEKLFFNMNKAGADYLYGLQEWDGVLTEERRAEITKEYKRSKIVVKPKKIGRNDPCPCGSGKKYKYCCMKKDQAAGRY